MTITVKHKFQSAKADSADASLIRPSNWNDTHDITMATARIMGRYSAGDGVVQEVSLGTGLSFSGSSIALSAALQQMSALTPTDGNFIVGNGTAWVAENAATARASLGLGTAATAASTSFASSAYSIVAGNGLEGGGTLAASRTLTLGTPGSISNSTTNSVTSTSHTHALGFTAAEVYTGSDGNAVNFPVGHPILVQYNANVPRNSTLSPALKSDDNGAYVNASSADAGTGLTGTWRSRGGLGGGDNNTWLLAVRTA